MEKPRSSGYQLPRSQDDIYRRWALTRAAISEAIASQLPGRENGPADAYRHLLWAGELTRMYGETIARTILEGHERSGRGQGQNPNAEEMDRFNNEIGIRIGLEARTFGDVIERARQIMDRSDRSGDGRRGGARWLDPSRWRLNPIDGTGRELSNQDANWPNTDWRGRYVPEPYQYPYGNESDRMHDPNHHYRGWNTSKPPQMGIGDMIAASAIHKPIEQWSDFDIQAIMSHDAYLSNEFPDSSEVRQKVRRFFDHPARNANENDGPVQVRAHTREGHEVHSYFRSRPRSSG